MLFWEISPSPGMDNYSPALTPSVCRRQRVCARAHVHTCVTRVGWKSLKDDELVSLHWKMQKAFRYMEYSFALKTCPVWAKLGVNPGSEIELLLQSSARHRGPLGMPAQQVLGFPNCMPGRQFRCLDDYSFGFSVIVAILTQETV